MVYTDDGDRMVLQDITKNESNQDLINMVSKISSLTKMLSQMNDITIE